MTYVNDLLNAQMRKQGKSVDTILENTSMEKDELEMLLEGRIPAELILTHDFMSLCRYLQINP